MATVAELLRLSRAKNDGFHQHQQAGRISESLAELRAAQAARLEAEAADPMHADGAWAQDKAPSAGILRFYELYLAKHER